MNNLIPLIIFIFPIAAIVIGAIGCLIFKNMWITPLIVKIISIILTYTVFNPTFWFWVAIYTFLAFVTGFIINLVYNKKAAT